MERKKLYITLLIIFIIVLCIGGTFALVVTSNAINITQIKAGNLTMTISGGDSENVSFVPSECTGESAIKKTIVAKATNTSGGKVSFSIGFNITTLSDTYKKDTIRYALSTSATSCTDGLIANGTFKDKTVNSDIWLIKNDYDNITKSGNTYTKTYYLYIWLDESEEEYFDGNISVKLKGSSSNNPNLTTEAVINIKDTTIYGYMKSNADKTTTINFSQTSEASNTNGIYMTTDTDSGKPVYYYRGNVDNHLIFANYCWRIVRTTETGGVKLIYNGVPTDGQCNNTGDATTIGNSTFNSYSSSPADVGYMYGARYATASKNISSLSGSIVFGNDITYENGSYTLADTYTLTDISNWSTEYSTIASKYHYTCFTSSDTCEKVNYIHYTSSSRTYYFQLSGGENHLDILKEMLDNSTNENDSTIKTAIDNWYKNNMTSYTSKLEDTIFCNDRSYDVSKTGWNKDYSNSNSNSALCFNSYQRRINYKPTLVCANTNDKFTVEASNGNGALDNPVGLLSVDEMMYAGATSSSNSSFYLYTNSYVWALSPYVFYVSNAGGFYLGSTGGLNSTDVYVSDGVRPVISLKPKTEFTGSGTATDPFIVE